MSRRILQEDAEDDEVLEAEIDEALEDTQPPPPPPAITK